MSYQPKPTGEWTVEHRLLAKLSYSQACEIADTHNAALAAEHVVYERLEKSILDLSHPNFKMLTDQLTSEREKVTLATQMVQIESKRANEAEQKVQTLVDALTEALSDIETSNDQLSTCSKIRTALAKVAK